MVPSAPAIFSLSVPDMGRSAVPGCSGHWLRLGHSTHTACAGDRRRQPVRARDWLACHPRAACGDCFPKEPRRSAHAEGKQIQTHNVRCPSRARGLSSPAPVPSAGAMSRCRMSNSDSFVQILAEELKRLLSADSSLLQPIAQLPRQGWIHRPDEPEQNVNLASRVIRERA